MDVSQPAIQIFYGKYLDAITNEIPADHIDPQKNGPFHITLEPGKPNFPTRDSASITLVNLDVEGNILYPKQWFIDQSKSEGEGAIYPFELFFRVFVYGEAAFTGIYGEKKYSVHNDEVTITLNSIVGLLEKADKPLVEFNYGNCTIASVNQSSNYALANGKDLEANVIHSKVISVLIEETPKLYPITPAIDYINDVEIMKHLGYTYADFSVFNGSTLIADVGDVVSRTDEIGTFSAYVKIGDSTILTRCSIFATQIVYGPLTGTAPGVSAFRFKLYINVWHADNANFTDKDDVIILQRGRFFKDLKGADYSKGDKTEFTLWSPDRGNNPEVFLKEDDIFIPTSLIVVPPPEYIHGVRWDVDGSDYQIAVSALNKDYFDIFKLTLDSISAFYSNFYQTPAEADFFDLTLAGNEGRKAFIADAIMFGWIGDKNTVKDLIVALARQTNSYLYANAMGKVVYQSRGLNNADYDTDTTPVDAINLDSNAYMFTSGEGEDFGFDTFELKIPIDIVEINNLVSTTENNVFINYTGVVSKPGLRNTSLELSNFRIYNLAVPEEQYVDFFGVWRKSPTNATFPDYTATLIDEFIKTPVELATEYAKRFTWPTEFIYPKLPGQYYEDVQEGSFMYRDKDGKRTIYLVTKISRSTDLFKSIELKKEAEWGVV